MTPHLYTPQRYLLANFIKYVRAKYFYPTMTQILIVGGGIIGLSSAYHLRSAGYDVKVLDQGDFQDNCSYGNAGYICPSHIVPLASPGKVRQGIKWMFNAQSPFYVKPALNRDLLEWGWTFMRSATKDHVARSAVPLRDIALLSQHEYQQWSQQPEFDFALEHKGLLEIFRTETGEQHAHEATRKSREVGLDVDLLNRDELLQLEPGISINASGAIHYKCDAHVFPNRVMHSLQKVLTAQGVQLLPHQKVLRLEHSGKQIQHVVTDKSTFDADYVVLAAGSWSKQLADSVEVSFPLMPGRGYSMTLSNGVFQLRHPALLLERSVALTPLDGNTMRFGGTMEVVPIGTPPRYRRVQGIVNAVNEYFPEAHLNVPPTEDIWFGYRPCSADGLPYIGHTQKYNNLLIATGHSMLGMSLGAGTGKLIAELVMEKTPSINMAPFRVERFG